MRKSIVLLFIAISCSFNSYSQDGWFTSFDVAKRLALTQNKMLFVMWEDALIEPYYILVKNERGNVVVTDILENDAIQETIWEYFVPVLLPEDAYGDFLDNLIDETNDAYMQKLDDDSIKIMDVSGKILNVKTSSLAAENLTDIIERYAINTSYLNPYLRSYLKERNLNTTFMLASKYLDFGIFAKNDRTRSEIVRLAAMYFEEARNFVTDDKSGKHDAYLQKLDLQEIKSALILSKPKKARRMLKKFNPTDIHEFNEGLFNFLNYTTFMILDEQDEANEWKGDINEADLRKATLIININ